MAQFSYEGGTPCCWGEHGIYSAAPAILHQPKAVAVQMMRTIPKEHFIPARAGGETYSNFLLEQKGSGPDGMGPGLTYSTTVASRHHVGKQNRGRMVTVRRDAKLVLLSDTGDEWVWSWEVEASSDMSVIITEMKWLIRYKVTGAHDEMQSVLTYGVEYDFPLCYKVIPKLMIFLPCFWPHLAFCLGLYGVCIPCCHAQRTCGGGMEKDMALLSKTPLSNIRGYIQSGPQQQVMTDTPNAVMMQPMMMQPGQQQMMMVMQPGQQQMMAMMQPGQQQQMVMMQPGQQQEEPPPAYSATAQLLSTRP